MLGYGFSLLAAKGRIDMHAHRKPFVTAMLGLSVGQSCWLTVDGESRRILTGRMLVFDYTLPHGVSNQSSEERLVLLVLLPNKSVAGGSAGTPSHDRRNLEFARS